MATKGIKGDKASKEESTGVVILENSYKQLHYDFEDLLLEYKSLAKNIRHSKRSLT